MTLVRGIREQLAGALVLVALVVVFLREPILHYRTVTFTTADITQYMSLTRLEPGYVVRNQLVTDPITQFVPWLEFNARELGSGRVPLWNPFNGCGAPHLGNLQSAVFSPFSALFYAFSLKFALLASAFLKLFLLGFGTFLFLRRVGLAWLPALFGGALFMFSGHNALLVSYPHSAVIAFMPFALLAAESVLQGFERDQRERQRGRRPGTWIGFVAALTAMIYAGHPEALCFAVAVVALWIGVRLVVWWQRNGSTRPAAELGARFVIAALLAVGLSAPQLLPFFEYLGHSATLAQRGSAGPTPLDFASWPRYFFPDLLGSPGRRDAFAPALPPPNYEAATLGYVGALTLLLALLGLPRAIRDARFAPLAVLALAWVFWAHDLFGASRVVDAIPLLRHLPIPVSQGPWAFALACIAAFALDGWLQTKRSWIASASIVIIGALALWTFHGGAVRFVRGAIERYHPSADALAGYEHHLVFVVATFAIGLVAFAAIPLLAARGARLALASIVFAATCAQTGWLLSFHNTSCLDRYVFPVPPQLARVKSLAGGARILLVGQEGIPACSNVAYELDQPAIYDGLGIRTLDELYQQLFRGDNGWRQARRANKSGLRLFGVEWLLLRLSAAEVDAALASWAADSSGDGDALKPRERAGDFQVFEFTRALGRQWLVGNARSAATPREAFELVSAKGFDAGDTVVLGPELPASFEVRTEAGATAATRVDAIERTPTRLRLHVEHERPAYLVLTLPWYPGWRATLDGRTAELARANYAFTALDVPAGRHEIELAYAPASWTLGLWIAAVSLALGALATALGFANRRTARASLTSTGP